MKAVAKPVVASTVILARDGEPVGRPWQCFMVRRHVKSDFAADVFVFPGGKVDASDEDSALARHLTGHPGPESAEPPALWQAVRVAAIRELFEEAGVLIAHRRDGTPLPSDDGDAERFTRYRDELRRGELTVAGLAEREDLTLPLDAVHQISRWITPSSFPRRFDTYFFVAHLPQGQEPLHDAHETTEGVWIAPADALVRYAEGTFPLVFATEKHLELLARHASIDSLINATTLSDLQPIMPRPVEENGGTRFLLPGDPGY